MGSSWMDLAGIWAISSAEWTISRGKIWVAKVMDIDTPMDSQKDDPWNPCIFGLHMWLFWGIYVNFRGVTLDMLEFHVGYRRSKLDWIGFGDSDSFGKDLPSQPFFSRRLAERKTADELKGSAPFFKCNYGERKPFLWQVLPKAAETQERSESGNKCLLLLLLSRWSGGNIFL